jgi:hypothetical protein
MSDAKPFPPAYTPGPVISLLPPNARILVDGGGNDGVLARAYKERYPAGLLHAIEADARRATLARRHADIVHETDLDLASDALLRQLTWADGWAFDGVLERLRDPGRLLARIAAVLQPDACVVARIANGQHWRGLTALAGGAIASPMPLRLFSRATIMELFARHGFRIDAGIALGMTPPGADVETALRRLSGASGIDPEQALQDALPTHYLIKAVPA